MSNGYEVLDLESGRIVVQVARQGLEQYVRFGETYRPELLGLPASLQEPGASFVRDAGRKPPLGMIRYSPRTETPAAESAAITSRLPPMYCTW